MGGSLPLNHTLYFDVITSNVATGAVSDADSPPTFSVFEDGSADPLAAYTNEAMLQRGALTGDYYGTVQITGANGFGVGKNYNIVATGTVNLVTGKSPAFYFRVGMPETVAGAQVVDIGYLLGSAEDAATLQFSLRGVVEGDTVGVVPASNQVTLADKSPETDISLANMVIVLVDGTGISQVRRIDTYDKSTRLATVDRDWDIDPPAGSRYHVLGLIL